MRARVVDVAPGFPRISNNDLEERWANVQFDAAVMVDMGEFRNFCIAVLAIFYPLAHTFRAPLHQCRPADWGRLLGEIHAGPPPCLLCV